MLSAQSVSKIPPNKCNLEIKALRQNDARHSAMLASAGLPGASHIDKMPYFNWADPSSVEKHRMKGLPRDAIMSPENQGSCGSCWAFSTSSVMGDRWAILHKKNNPHISAQAALACASFVTPTQGQSSQGCNGGFPSDAACFFSKSGGVTKKCVPYVSGDTGETGSCCSQGNEPEPAPASALTVTNIQCPAGKPCSRCSSGGKPKYYFAKRGSVVSLTGGSQEDIISRMKANIFAGGPIVGAYKVYHDFMTLKPSSWKDGIYRYDGTSKMDGGHAVTIVGWGTQNGTPYWIVRNSWGPGWNSKAQFRVQGGKGWHKGGYFRAVMGTHGQNGGLDANNFGGATSFEVSPDRGVQLPAYHPHTGTEPHTMHSPESTTGKPSKTWLWWTMGITGVLVLVIVLVIVAMLAKKKQLY